MHHNDSNEQCWTYTYKYNIYLVTHGIRGCTTTVSFFPEAERRTPNSNSATRKTHTLSSPSLGNITHAHVLDEYSIVVSVWVSLIITILHPQCLYCSFSGHSGSVHRVTSLLLRHYISLHSDSGNRFWSVRWRFFFFLSLFINHTRNQDLLARSMQPESKTKNATANSDTSTVLLTQNRKGSALLNMLFADWSITRKKSMKWQRNQTWYW